MATAAVLGLSLLASCDDEASTPGPTQSGPPSASSQPSSQPPPASSTTPTPVTTGPSPSPDATASTSARMAIITGRVLRGNGPDPRSGAGGAGRAPVAGDPVEALNDKGGVTARDVTDANGAFRMVVPEGEYTVVESLTGASQSVRARRDNPVDITLTTRVS